MAGTNSNHYRSAEPMTPPQLKRLIEIATSVVPADMTKGFAQQLIDGGFRKAVVEPLEKARYRWQQDYCHLTPLDRITVPKTPCSSISAFWKEKGLLIAFYATPGGLVNNENLKYAETPETVVRIYRPTTREFGFVHLEELTKLRSAPWQVGIVTPIQVLMLIDQELLSRHGAYWFIVGKKGGTFILWRVYRRETAGSWEIREEKISTQLPFSVDDVLVFSE